MGGRWLVDNDFFVKKTKGVFLCFHAESEGFVPQPRCV